MRIAPPAAFCGPHAPTQRARHGFKMADRLGLASLLFRSLRSVGTPRLGQQGRLRAASGAWCARNRVSEPSGGRATARQAGRADLARLGRTPTPDLCGIPSARRQRQGEHVPSDATRPQDRAPAPGVGRQHPRLSSLLPSSPGPPGEEENFPDAWLYSQHGLARPHLGLSARPHLGLSA